MIFCDPSISINDMVKVDIRTNKIVSHHSFEAGAVVFIYSGSNQGRVGVIKRMEVQTDGKTFIYLEDSNGKLFSVLMTKAIVIGNGVELLISLDEQQESASVQDE
ncbi:unnamed protein product [Medioppia subpectinata]|uniref:KOW domain-containing protein n=1 Tax=Medioppia subpectinata TaxID=1979941 RepID=A0A7R9PTM8_9ACAR|nr:unnamed protein product [Medioppia subpectinata]CAG2099932.1 unnamed protein product [Medioppia subpectinata]